MVVNHQSAAKKLNITHPQSDRFTPPQPAISKGENQSRVLRFHRQPAHIFGGQIDMTLRCFLRQVLHTASRVGPQQTSLHRIIQDSGEHTVRRLRDRLCDQIDRTDSSRDVAALSRQLTDMLRQIDGAGRESADEDAILMSWRGVVLLGMVSSFVVTF
jgi:hypothetical protein